MPRKPTDSAKQAALDELVMAALAIATRYRTDIANLPHPPRERSRHPGTGIEFNNGFTVPVVLLNRLAAASRGFTGLITVPSQKPPARHIEPMHVLLDSSGSDC